MTLQNGEKKTLEIQIDSIDQISPSDKQNITYINVK